MFIALIVFFVFKFCLTNKYKVSINDQVNADDKKFHLLKDDAMDGNTATGHGQQAETEMKA